MPNFDGGHYFLTVLAPVRLGVDPMAPQPRSHRHVLAQKLSLLPTGRQTANSPDDDPPSPFAGNTINHLARFVLIDGPAFNGRLSGDTLVAAARGINPLVAQPVDQLGTPYLLFAADVDATGGGEDALRAYTDALWATMRADLVEIFRHCFGFDSINDAGAFHDYIVRCQVETTMPFNDYWPGKLQAEAWPSMPLVVATVAVPLVIVVWLLVIFGRQTWPLVIIVLLGAVYGVYRAVLQRGLRPFATAPGSDLPSVLKALFLQQRFTQFAIEAQGLGDAALHEQFGAFLAAVRPGDPAPTQQPGEIHA